MTVVSCVLITATFVAAHSAQAFLLLKEKVGVKTQKVAVLVGKRKKKRNSYAGEVLSSRN
jgi:hypothetical protein